MSVHDVGLLDASHTVQVASHAREYPVVRYLHPSKKRIVSPPADESSTRVDPHAEASFDFLCGQIRILVCVMSNLQDRQRQASFGSRIRRCRQNSSKTAAVVVLVMCDVEEPPLDVLSWLNEVCLVDQCNLQISWTDEGAARLLEGLSDSMATSTDFVSRPRETASLPALIDALTQPDTHLIKQDALRLASKFGTVANMLMLAPDNAGALPSFGPKKTSRVGEIFRAQFGTTASQQVAGWSPGGTTAVRTRGTFHAPSVPAATPDSARSDAFLAALTRHRLQEEEDAGT
jgi:hypothetical protein